MEVILTSTSDRKWEFNYRLPNGQVMTVEVPPYALNQKFFFPSEELYESFKRQNQLYFIGEKPILIEGKSTGSKAERIYTDREVSKARVMEAAVDAAVESVTSAVKESGANIAVEIQTGGAPEGVRKGAKK